ncbi:hypothetical protein SS1G_04122 [Sclerotinia sclerotiorum 1980 UF-70]|uniref:Major facilitator superfamily (MFS) profile domain-containing protein n=1 Tax=Sclerotinia sclerotiorum (strain ATCC 18683 / 1980 / Ss-1) TaxID=665079 RepID=A7EFN1_SCLS1|nr:hypothetical protein SS1G_04122 [Sclerotinia sclerotiorum 1980 UF-70]EDO01647.1 hypothetical protein SS1G_04122 [Sclerotinia sclerotiorum 1980 UF-70]
MVAAGGSVDVDVTTALPAQTAATAEDKIPVEISSSREKTCLSPSSSSSSSFPEFKPSYRFWCIIIGLGITNLLGALENIVVSTAAPVILSDLHMGQNFIWITNAFFIDIIVSDLVPLRQRGNYMAVILAIYGIGVSLGPFIGGAIVYSTTWRWVFYLNLPIGGTSLIVLYLFLQVNYNKDVGFVQKLQRIDVVGNGILMAGAVAILYALSISNPWSSWHKLVPLILGFLSFFIFAVYEASGIPSEPVIPTRLFTNRTSIIVSINTFLNSALLFWVMFFLPVYFQAVALYSPRRTGVALLPYSLVGIPGAAISAMALSRWATWYFIRTFGYVWGVAIPAAIFNSRVAVLRWRISDEGLRQQLESGSAYQLAAAQFIEHYPIDVQGEIRTVYREALKRVWQIAVVFAGIACVLVLLEKEIPLRTVLETDYGLKESPKDSREEKDVERNQD